jgi:DNA-directed RNA polymerase specialized sigma24 family protein
MSKKKNQITQTEVTEEELLATIDTISKKLAYKFKFGYHEIEDMRQQISVFALEGLMNYDRKRPLENFLWTHVRNRLFNFKRDNYQRPDKPCTSCPFFRPNNPSFPSACAKFTDTTECQEYSTWYNRNNSKKNLMYLNTVEDIKEYIVNYANDHIENVSNNEILDIIEEEICGDARKIYLKLKTGIKINKSEMLLLINDIKEIIDG